MPLPNRLAVYLTALAGLAAALAPAVANLDLTSTVGVAAGFAGITTVVHKWLEGWQKDEERYHLEAVIKEREARGLGDVPPAGQ